MQDTNIDFDTVVVGAGWGGMCLVHRLRKAGFSMRVFETGSNVGGTWYWNRYPGCRVDTPSLDYSLSIDEDLQQEWHWPEFYSTQPELERYARHVAERLDLYRDMQFNTRVTAAIFDPEAKLWKVSTDKGDRVTARYVIMATGGYAEPVVPTIPNIDQYKGELYYTARYPKEAPDYRGKRIGVIGTGSSGMQTATQLARFEDVGHLYVFQRTANFAVPSWNRPMDPDYERQIKAQYASRRELARNSGNGTAWDSWGVPSGPIENLSEEEFQSRMDKAWALGGAGTLVSFSDIMTSEKANERIADYVRQRIRARVRNPEVAERLVPRGHFIGARRILIEDGYFEIFNQENVTLVDVKDDPIREFTPKGLRVGNRDYELDMIICATGFDSGTGAILNIDIRGENGIRIADKWSQELYTYLGVMIQGFPNLFSVDGPGSPSIRSNMLTSCEQHAEWIARMLEYAREHDVLTIEPSPEAEKKWTQHVEDIARATLLTRNDTQYIGQNVPGKLRRYLAYAGGVGRYRDVCEGVRSRGYEGFVFRTASGALENKPSWSGPAPTDGAKMGQVWTVV